jgi:AcrR family transcriptional regulator
VGHREDLLAGAKKCLYEKGYARTTARDIVAASGTNLASIGYHYGSKEALLNQAMFEAIGEVGDELERAVAASVGPDATPIERFAAFWTYLLDNFEAHKHLWSATFEIYAQIDRMPEVRQLIIEGIHQGRTGWALLFQGIDATTDPKKAHAAGSIFYSLMAGTLAQWLIDPEHAPSAAEMVEGMRLVARSFGGDDPAGAPPRGDAPAGSDA